MAIKVIKPEIAVQPGYRRRFSKEVAAARLVSGTFTAAVVNFDVDADLPWLATEYVDGPTLRELVKRDGTFDDAKFEALASGLVEAVKGIHLAGVIHRDLNPSNILWTTSAGPRVIDFGIAKLLNESVTSGDLSLGTPGFLSPEQAIGQRVGPQTDVFSLAACLVYCRTGRSPFGDGDQGALLYKTAREDATVDGVPPIHREWVRRCLRKAPSSRPTLGQIAKYMEHAPNSLYRRCRFISRPRAALIIAIACALFVALTGLVMPRQIDTSGSNGGSMQATDEKQITSPPIPVFRTAQTASLERPYDVAISPDGTRAYVSYGLADGFVAVLDASTLKPLQSPIFVGNYPASLAISPDGNRLYVTRTTAGNVSVVDVRNSKRSGTPIGVGDLPIHLSLSPDGSKLYVLNGYSQNVQTIDTVSSAVIGRPVGVGDGTGSDAWSMSISADGNYLYVSEQVSNKVAVIDTRTNSVIKHFPATFAHCAAATRDGKKLYVASYSPGSVLVLDATSGNPLRDPILTGGNPEACRASPDARYVYVLDSSGLVYIISDLTSSLVGEPVRVGLEGNTLSISPDGRRIYVANPSFNSVSVVERVS